MLQLSSDIQVRSDVSQSIHLKELFSAFFGLAKWKWSVYYYFDLSFGGRLNRIDDPQTLRMCWRTIEDLFEQNKPTELQKTGFTILCSLLENQYENLEPLLRHGIWRNETKHTNFNNLSHSLIHNTHTHTLSLVFFQTFLVGFCSCVVWIWIRYWFVLCLCW